MPQPNPAHPTATGHSGLHTDTSLPVLQGPVQMRGPSQRLPGPSNSQRNSFFEDNYVFLYNYFLASFLTHIIQQLC